MRRLFNSLLIIIFITVSISCKPEIKYIEIEKTPKEDITPPSSIKNLSVTMGDSKAVFIWEKPNNDDLFAIKIYNAELSSRATVSLSDGILVNPENCSYVLYDLINDKEYIFKISTVDKNLNESEITKIKGTPSVSTDKTPPATVSNLTSIAGDGKILIDWTNPTDSDLLGVKISMTPAEGSLKTPVILQNTNNFEISGLQNGKAYSFTVKSLDYSLNESTGISVSDTPVDSSDRTPPATVTNLTSIAGDGKILIDWSNPTDSDLLGVKISMTPAEGSLKTPIILQNTNNFEISGLQNGKAYSFTLKSLDYSLNESTGVSVSNTPVDSSDRTPPATVSNLTSIAGDGKILIDWSNPTDSDLLGVKISMTPAEGSLKTPVILQNTNNFEISDLQNGKAYSFTVKSLDYSLNESTGVSVSNTPVDSSDRTPPATVSNLTSIAGDGKILIDWSNPTDSDLLGVKISMTPAEGSLKTPVILQNTNNFEISDLQNGKAYSFTVKSLDYSLNESTGVSVSNTPVDSSDRTPPATISNLRASSGDKDILLEWQNPTDSDFAGVEISMSPAESSLSKPIRVLRSTSFAIGKLENNKQYTFSIKAFDINNNFSSAKTISAIPSATIQSPMEIELTKTTDIPTNENVTIVVNPITNAEIKKVSYKKGQYNSAAILLSEGSEILKQNGIYQFEVTENGYYSVAVQDILGRREIKQILVSNIDRIAPNEISIIDYSYSNTSKSINLNWINPVDTDFCKLLLFYNDGNINSCTEELDKNITSYCLNNIEANNSFFYTFIIKTIDDVGNISTGVTIQVLVQASPYISRITVNRSHIANNDPNKTVKVTAYGANFDKINDMEDKSIYFQIVNDTDITSFSVTDIDIVNNTCEADIVVPTIESWGVKAPWYGIDLTIRSKICGEIDNNNTAIINISEEASITSILLEQTDLDINNLNSSSTIDITLKGDNLDVPVGQKTICFYDCYQDLYQTEYYYEPSSVYKAKEVVIHNVPIPLVNDIYTIKIDNVLCTQKLHIYDSPRFDDFIIPPASIHKMDSFVKAIVNGKNFTAPSFDKNKIEITSSRNSITSNSSITIVDDNHLEILLKIPDIVGEYEINLSYENVLLSSLLIIKDFSQLCTGDIVYSDGSYSSKDNYDVSKTPIAIVLQDENGYCYGIGLNQLSKNFDASSTNKMYKQIYKNICILDGIDFDSVTFIGDYYGFDNWTNICSFDSTANVSTKELYTPFYYARDYSTIGDPNIQNTIYEQEWFVPSIKELQLIYKNMTILNESLSIVNGTTLSGMYCSSNTGWYYSRNNTGSKIECYGNYIYWVLNMFSTPYHYGYHVDLSTVFIHPWLGTSGGTYELNIRPIIKL